MDSFLRWIGGKKALRNKLLEHFPEQGSYERYIEVFGGAGWLLFAKDRHAKLEVYNDINENLVNLFRCVKYHDEELDRQLEWTLVSREQFVDAKEQLSIRGLTDIQRAARFYILIKQSFGADIRNFGLDSRNMEKARGYLKEVSRRLNKVVIENVDFERLINTYDREKAFFYLDPPYYDAEKRYPDRFNPEDHERLKNRLLELKGRFVLSYNDCEPIRALYSDYEIIKVERFNNLFKENENKRYHELIIKNF